MNGLGYFSVSIGSTESENPKKMTRGTVQITGVNFQPEKSFKKSIISRAHFVRERYKVHTVDLSPIEVDGLLSEYFKDHRSITCARMQQVCGMTRSTRIPPPTGTDPRSPSVITTRGLQKCHCLHTG
nr:hypothetical protein [Phocaeicola vulgatus]